MGTIANLAVQLSMDAAAFEQGVSSALAKTQGLGDRLASMGRTMTVGVTAPLVGAAGAAIKFATDFNGMLGGLGDVFANVISCLLNS